MDNSRDERGILRDPTASELGVKGLPVHGYKPTQSPEAIAAVNAFKELEERVLRHIDHLASTPGNEPDKRLLAIGRTQLQGAFMFLACAVFQPGRIALPEDEPADLLELRKLDANSRDGKFL